MASPKDIAIAIRKLQYAFPKMENAFFDILTERIVDNGFTRDRLQDSVNNVLDNFCYKELNIADVIKFDKRVKLYSYAEACSLVTSGKASFEDFEIREINGKKYRVKKIDLLR